MTTQFLGSSAQWAAQGFFRILVESDTAASQLISGYLFKPQHSLLNSESSFCSSWKLDVKNTLRSRVWLILQQPITPSPRRLLFLISLCFLSIFPALSDTDKSTSYTNLWKTGNALSDEQTCFIVTANVFQQVSTQIQTFPGVLA